MFVPLDSERSRDSSKTIQHFHVHNDLKSCTKDPVYCILMVVANTIGIANGQGSPSETLEIDAVPDRSFAAAAARISSGLKSNLFERPKYLACKKNITIFLLKSLEFFRLNWRVYTRIGKTCGIQFSSILLASSYLMVVRNLPRGYAHTLMTLV